MTDDPSGFEDLVASTSRPIDPRWWAQVRVIRTARASARLVHETFWLDLAADHGPWRIPIDQLIADSDGEVVVGEQSYSSQPPLGPVTLWMRTLPGEASADAVERLMSGNVAPGEDPIEPVAPTVVVARGVEPMSDSALWGWLALLGGKPTYGAIDRVAVRLAREDDETILAFAQAVMRLAESLDTPDPDERWTNDRGLWCATETLDEWRRGAILAGGESTYSAAIRDGARTEHHPVSDGSWAVPYIGAFALSKRRCEDVRIETDWRSKAGSNTTAWGGLIPSERPYRSPPDVIARLAADAEEQKHVWKEATGEEFDESWGGVTIRFAVDDGVCVHEVVQFVLFLGDLSAAKVLAERCAEATARTMGGTRVGPIEIENPHTGYPMSGKVFDQAALLRRDREVSAGIRALARTGIAWF